MSSKASMYQYRAHSNVFACALAREYIEAHKRRGIRVHVHSSKLQAFYTAQRALRERDIDLRDYAEFTLISWFDDYFKHKSRSLPVNVFLSVSAMDRYIEHSNATGVGSVNQEDKVVLERLAEQLEYMLGTLYVHMTINGKTVSRDDVMQELEPVLPVGISLAMMEKHTPNVLQVMHSQLKLTEPPESYDDIAVDILTQGE